MELLERDGALAVLADASTFAARGEGRLALVTGEPGIGKTSLIRRFVDRLPAHARVLIGACDDLSIPRPLGPIRDLAGAVSDQLGKSLANGAPPHEVVERLLEELQSPPHPTVLVVEDVHWADDATLDAITVLGRRIDTLPALIVLTFRSGEVPPGHRLHAAIGAVRAESSVTLELEPLSERAVASLAGDEQAAKIFAVSRGNPFYVTELLTDRTGSTLPMSVANSVLGRAARLDRHARELVELVSVVPGRVRTSLLDAVMPDWSIWAEEPERRQLLEVDRLSVRFRHELARHAILSGMPSVTRRRLHGEILEALLADEADPADIVHHAEAAGNDDVVADYALVAARRAAGAGSNREAYSHYRRAKSFVDRRPPAEQATILEEIANAAYLADRVQEAFEPMNAAIRIHRQLDDAEALGRCTRVLSRLHWFAGSGDLARARALEAVAILEPFGESFELARAYSGVSQIEMLAQDLPQAIAWGNRALELAMRLGDESTRAHALVNIGVARMQLDPHETTFLLDAHAIADAVGDRHEAIRALVGLGFTHMYWMKPESAMVFARQALAYAQQYEVHSLASYAQTTVAWLLLRAGEWDEAERITRQEVVKGITVNQLLAKTVLTELAVRRGDPDADERLADLTSQAARTGDLQRITPVIELSTERALLTGAPMPLPLFDKLIEDTRGRGGLVGWAAFRMAAWASVAGAHRDVHGGSASPLLGMIARDWQSAADSFGNIGWMYDRGLMLSLLDEQAALVESLEIARQLGADPLIKRVTRRMRELSMRVPHGRRETTRINPGGLTDRQVEVLTLVAAGATNAEIADRLVVSQRTAEHHVAAVLTKLGVTSRQDAARRAMELGLTEPV